MTTVLMHANIGRRPTERRSVIEPKSPEDRDVQRDEWRALARRAAFWGMPLAGVGWLLIALGIPWWIVLIALGAFGGFIIFEA